MTVQFNKNTHLSSETLEQRREKLESIQWILGHGLDKAYERLEDGRTSSNIFLNIQRTLMMREYVIT